MAGGVQSEYDKIKGINVFEFWGIFDMWRKKLKEDTNNLKNGKRK